MVSAELHGAAAVWDIATPSGTGRLAGVSMAGFRQQTADELDLRPVPYPAVTLAVDLGEGSSVVDDGTGREQRGSVLIGMAPHGLRVRGRNVEGLQVRLSPLVAHA